MHLSQVRLAANRLNALRDTPPKRPKKGQKASPLREGLEPRPTGEGVLVGKGDADEIARRIEAFTADMRPRTATGKMLIIQIATLSVRSERASQQEEAAIARRARSAIEDFDDERMKRVHQLFDNLEADLTNNLRKLKKMPEGVSHLVDEWIEIRDDLIKAPLPIWTGEHLLRAASLMGIPRDHARSSRLGALSRGVWGDFARLEASDGGDLDEEARQRWSADHLLALIDAEIDALEAHYQTLDFKTIELDRRDAPHRAMFDGSKESILLRSYEEATDRAFYKALKEFREAEGITRSRK